MKLLRNLIARLHIITLALFLTASSFVSAINAQQQTTQNTDALVAKVEEYIKKQNYLEALPILEELVIASPENAYAHYHLGFALLMKATTLKETSARPALRIRARNQFIKAKELGIQEPNVEAMISSLPDGNEGADFSKNQVAHKLMEEGEYYFSQGKRDEALNSYQKALQLDPKLYEAALFSGDIYLQKADFANAEIWYQKAIAINPDRETAYRYSATPLMKQKKFDQARDRYIEAYITEPYSRFAQSSLMQWAQITNTPLGHPKIDIPTDVSFDEKGDAKINLDENVLLGSKDDGSFAWISYGATRSVWRKEKFAKTFPAEKDYRHTLAEETDALRSVITMASEKNKDLKKLSATLTALKKLNDAGLLEAYILMAQPDQEIAQDHAAYLKNNRAKLRQYAVEYVIGGK